jgi:hypothetical protein
MQTASLGSMDRNQREALAGPSFQGFRVIAVENDTISKIHYVTLNALRQRKSPIATTPISNPSPNGDKLA